MVCPMASEISATARRAAWAVYPRFFDRAAGVGLFPRSGERHADSGFRRPVLIQPSALLIQRF